MNPQSQMKLYLAPSASRLNPIAARSAQDVYNHTADGAICYCELLTTAKGVDGKWYRIKLEPIEQSKPSK